ncbi:hypothetical protein [Staphylococcus sp. NAM3COL9]|uniref:hypothetical protein n=1 Tax=Staphylococcus sp. NAM3COL9 TaxID=1667172 RepID=UPI0007110D80|nr:hypothetical protein [Staphylococcus sp. NAM3COL9]KRG08146.1 hypothetical protein ACA31_10275 [Staphylococcus sp. NAM3COL9]
MYNLEFHHLEQHISKLLNLLEIYKFAIVTNHKKKNDFKENIHDYIDKEYSALKSVSKHHASLIHYNYFKFLSDQIEQPIDELTIGNTTKYISDIQQRLFRIHQLLTSFL